MNYWLPTKRRALSSAVGPTKSILQPALQHNLRAALFLLVTAGSAAAQCAVLPFAL
jgi:hypothetical protein